MSYAANKVVHGCLFLFMFKLRLLGSVFSTSLHA